MNKKILVVGGGGYGRLVDGLAEVTGMFKTFFEQPDDFMCVFFTGGEDINPRLYGHATCVRTYTNNFRDHLEKQIYDSALEQSIPMIGVCRGLQWLNVMNGGLMIQHVDNHAMRGLHKTRSYRQTNFAANSLHHQMVYPHKSTYIVAVAAKKQSPVYHYDGNKRWPKGPVQEVESCFFPNSNSFGVQWHPEMMDHKDAARKFFIEHVGLLLSGELKGILDANDCPTMHDLEHFGDFGKYKKRYSRTQVALSRLREKTEKADRKKSHESHES